ncbi:MAG: hypothetical protein LLG04_04105 [Parachlamydia sp.]|nr:hypothetical protein [Parachlamydia sp.]
MEKMQAGEVVNFIQGYSSENRPVLHTAARDFFDRPNQAPAALEDIAGKTARQPLRPIDCLGDRKGSDNPNKVFPGNRPSYIMLAKQLTPFTLGALLSYYENKIAFQGFIWVIKLCYQGIQQVPGGKVGLSLIFAFFVVCLALRYCLTSATSYPSTRRTITLN